MLLWPPLSGTQLSPVAPRSWVLPSGHTPGNRYDQRAKPGEGLRCCVCLHTRYNNPILMTWYPHHRRLRRHHNQRWELSPKLSSMRPHIHLTHRPAETAASTALTVLVHSLIAWAYSVTCASMTVEFTATPTTPIPHANPPLLPLPRMTSPQHLPISPAHNFNSRIGLVGYLRIHRKEAGEPVPGAPTYSRNARLHYLHCSRTFTHRVGLLGHMCLHDNLR
ncbi:unnamed protein product [Schistocephalus solidus]|uniref:C2H2-type domain-containing protein n=1 Tax=Schistocephalus solidus TaxID=70667 RepID=A0A183S7L2_SCHSO|nr:unnamed protein product [Schistocephalus solidus]